MALYVSFNDALFDPTHTEADGVLLVESESLAANPCVGEGVKRTVPVLPSTIEEVRVFAHMMGWSFEFNQDNEVVLKTGLKP